MTDESLDRVLKYLYDVQNAITDIEEFTLNIPSLNIYEQNKLVRMATERSLITIGEAINRILAVEPNIAISSSRRIVQFRNRITHEYDAVDDTQVWVILTRYLPALKEEISQLIASRES